MEQELLQGVLTQKLKLRGNGMKYKVILWDFDGTLANTGADVWDSLEYAAGKLDG